MAAVASSLVGTGASPERVDAEIEQLTQAGRIVQLGQDIHGHGLYSTPEMIAIEKNLLKTASSLAQRDWTAVDPKQVEAEFRRRGLSDEQLQAALAATDGRALAIVEGAAGSGKTTMLKVVVGLSENKKIIGGAIAHRTAAMLRAELGIEATAIDRLLAQIKSGQHILDRNTVVLIDECGQVGTRTMNELISAVAKARAKLVLIGDREQLQPISAGHALKILSSVVQPARVDKIVRQREKWAQDAARAFGKGNAAEGLRAYAERGLLTG
jgi:ATP-dependent exoDNAse (exonuclease V) alpha subunit